MALKWIDGGEVWADSGYWSRAYASGDATSSSDARLPPGTRSLSMNDHLKTPSLGVQNTWIVGFGLKYSAGTFEWRCLDNDVEQCNLELVDNGSSFEIALKRGATTIATTAQAFSKSTWHYFELKVTVRTGTDGAYELRCNETTVLSGTGVNLADTGSDGCDAHSFGHGTPLMDDIYVCDDQGATNNDFLGDSVAVGLLPTADGATNDFAPSAGVDNYALVDDDEGIPSTADYVASDTNGHKDLYEFEDLPATGLGSIYGVKVTMSAAMETVGNRTLKPKFRSSGGSEGDGGDFVVDGTTVLEHPEILETNPVTASAWTKSDIDGGQLGVEVVS